MTVTAKSLIESLLNTAREYGISQSELSRELNNAIKKEVVYVVMFYV